MSRFDLLIKNGTIIDGSGSKMFEGDVEVSDGRIAETGDLAGEDGATVIDATDRYVAPGFIDNHAHSDWTILVHPTGDSKVMQGVTTELGGLCGYAAAPIDRDEWWKLLYVRMTVGWSMHYSAAAYNTWPLPYGRQVDVDWSSLGEYLDRLEKTGVGLNYGMMFGHGAVRYYAMGLEARKAERRELDDMKEVARQAMEDGGFGMSAGLSGCPGCWADTDELVELCGVVEGYGGVYMPHMRNSYLRSSIEETIEIAERSGVRTCMSHTRLNAETRRLVDEARARGVDISFNMYTYPGSIAGNIVYMLPRWLSRRREEGFDWIVERLRDPEVRRRFVEEDYPQWRSIQASVPGKPPHRWGADELEPAWSRMQVQQVWTAGNRRYVGMTFSEIAESRGVDPWTAWFDMMVEEDGYLRWLNFRGTSYEDICTTRPSSSSSRCRTSPSSPTRPSSRPGASRPPRPTPGPTARSRWSWAST